MLLHQLGEDLVLLGQLGFQLLDAMVAGIDAGLSDAVEGCRPVLEELLLPGAEDVGVQLEFVTQIGDGAFGGCVILEAAYFAGNAPVDSDSAFRDSMWGGMGDSPAKAYYLPGTKGWLPTFAERPTAPWVRPNPTILDFGDQFGPSPAGFSFVISWATNVPVVVEASADIGGAGWTPISTNTLTDGWVQFTDPDWKIQPARFYRVRGQ